MMEKQDQVTLQLLTGPGAGIPPIPSKYPQLPVAAEDGSCVQHHLLHQLHHGRTPTDFRRVSAARLTQALHTLLKAKAATLPISHKIGYPR